MFLISSWEQFARIASWRINRLKSSLISFSVIVIVSIFIVALAGIEPAHHRITQLPIHRHQDIPYIFNSDPTAPPSRQTSALMSEL